MKISKIVFSNGLEVTNITPDQSYRVSLLLFGDKSPKVETEVKSKKGGWRAIRWTEVEDDYIRIQAPHLSATKIARNLKRTPAAVYSRIRHLGIHKSDEMNNVKINLLRANA